MIYMRQFNAFSFDEDPSSKSDQGINFIRHEALLSRKFLQKRPPVKSKNINSYDLYYTCIQNLSDDGGEI